MSLLQCELVLPQVCFALFVYLVTILLVWQRTCALFIAFLKYLCLHGDIEEFLALSLEPLGLVASDPTCLSTEAITHIPLTKINCSPQVKGLDLSGEEIYFKSSCLLSPHKHWHKDYSQQPILSPSQELISGGRRKVSSPKQFHLFHVG